MLNGDALMWVDVGLQEVRLHPSTMCFIVFGSEKCNTKFVLVFFSTEVEDVAGFSVFSFHLFKIRAITSCYLY